MRTLELDFFADRPQGTRFGVLLLLASAVVAYVLLSSMDDMQRERALLQSELERIERDVRGIPAEAATIDEATAAEIRFANSVIDQLTLPWEGLFQAIEGTAFDNVVLIEITPDARNGSVEIIGEATDRDAMVDYVQRLGSQPQVNAVYLLSHQYDKRGGARPYRFTVTASWLEG